MLGFSIGKLLILAIVLLVVWYGFKMIARTGAPQQSSDDDSAGASRIDTEYDPESDSYVAKDTRKNSKKG